MNVLAMPTRGRSMAGGSATALPTPFHQDRIDRESLARLCERQIARGTTTLVVCGSTGEAAALRPEEYRLAIQVVVEAADGRVPVMAGCGAPATAAAAALAAIAAQTGAAALLCAPPPYVKPTQEGIIGHVNAIRTASGLPIMMYDVPGRTAVSIADATLARLFERGLIFGLKDATAELSRPTRLRALCGNGFLQMSGDDATAAAYRAAGGDGCVSVTANVAPGLCSLMHRSWDGADLSIFATLRDWLAAVSDLLFIESNPIPLKAALFTIGLAAADVRLPLTPASQETFRRLAEPIAVLTAMEEAVVARRSFRARELKDAFPSMTRLLSVFPDDQSRLVVRELLVQVGFGVAMMLGLFAAGFQTGPQVAAATVRVFTFYSVIDCCRAYYRRERVGAPSFNHWDQAAACNLFAIGIDLILQWPV